MPRSRQQHLENAGGSYNNFSENATKMVADGMPFEKARDKMLAEVRGNFDAFLKKRDTEKPWLYWFGPTLVHRKWVKGSGKATWGIEPESLKGKLPEFLPDVPEIREDFADYLGEIQGWDAGIGVLLQQLEAAGELENTLIVISGDHGDHGLHARQVQPLPEGFGAGHRAGNAHAGRRPGTRDRRLRST